MHQVASFYYMAPSFIIPNQTPQTSKDMPTPSMSLKENMPIPKITGLEGNEKKYVMESLLEIANGGNPKQYPNYVFERN